MAGRFNSKGTLVGSVASAELRVCDKHGEYESKITQVPAIAYVAATGCPECSREATAARVAREALQEAREAHQRLLAKLDRAGIPRRFRDRNFATYRPSCEGGRRALAIAQEYAEQFSDRLERGTCMIFTGKTGTGKTHLATAIANHIIRLGHTAVFMTVREMVGMVKATWSAKRGEKTELQVIRELSGVDLLILDEVGVQFDSDAEKLILFDVINARYENLRPTIVMSNFPVDAPSDSGLPTVRGFLGDRVLDRLRENGGRAVAFDWESWRRG